MPQHMQAKAVRMIAIDMDGTLLADDGRVSQRNLAAMLAAHASGVEVVVATGRRHSFAMHILRPLGLPHGCTLVSSNGTVMRTLGSAAPQPVASQLIARTHMPVETALWLCGHIGEFRNALVLTFDRVGADGEDSRGALVVEHLDQLNASIGRWMAANQPYIAQVDPIERALDPALADAPIQAMLCGTVERMARAETRLLEHPGVHASGHPSGRSGRTLGADGHAETLQAAAPAPAVPARPGSTPPAESVQDAPILTLHRTVYPGRDLSILDILPAGCSKGAAVLALSAARGIGPGQVLAIGDNWNDVSMLEIAGSAVLMANAPDDLKALAAARGWRIGPGNNHDGVAEAIEAALSAEALC